MKKRAPNYKGPWKPTEVWLMVSSAFLYPFESMFCFVWGFLNFQVWVLKFSRETNGLKYPAGTGKGYCLCPQTINILWVWLAPCKPPPPPLPASQRHWSGMCCQTESIVMAESHQIRTEAGWRPYNPSHLYFAPDSEQYRYSLKEVCVIQLTVLSRSFWFIFRILHIA